MQILFGTTIKIGSIAAVTLTTVSCSSTPNNEQEEYTLVDAAGLWKLLDLPTGATPDKNFFISINDKDFIPAVEYMPNLNWEENLLLEKWSTFNFDLITSSNPDREVLIKQYNDLSKQIKRKLLFSQYNKAVIIYSFLKDDFDNSVSEKSVEHMMAKIAQI